MELAIEAASSADFPVFGAAVHRQYNEMAKGELFVVDTVDLFESYLAAFPEGTNPIFRTRTEYDCTCCKNFVRHLGRVVSIKNGAITTVWSVDDLPYPFDVVAERMDAIVRQAAITGVFRSKERQYGTPHSIDTESGVRWEHFFGRVENRHYSANPDTDRGAVGTRVQVMRRGLEEFKMHAFDDVLELIDAKALYRGEEFRPAVAGFRDLLRDYGKAADKGAFVWSNADNRAALFRNSAIGGLITAISDGEDIESAVRKFEAQVAPTNYKRSTALITPKMIDLAVEKLRSLGLEDAVKRRYATRRDVSVNDVLFVDNRVQGEMRDGIAGLLMEAVKPTTQTIKNPTPISVEDFFERIVPQAQSIDVLVENRHLGNFVSLTAPINGSTGRLFRWGNDFGWSYDGEVADSIKQRVKAAGGNVTNAKLRVSLSWSNHDDLDIHSHGPDGHIYYGNKNGVLDVDMNVSPTTRSPVENLSWTSSRLRNGVYAIEVNNFTKRENIDVGFTIEVEGSGRVEQFSYARAVTGTVSALTITVANGEIVEIKPAKDVVGGSASVEKWGVDTNTLVPVDTIMLSPNHWVGEDNAEPHGNKHWIFMLKDCRNPDTTRGIYNEFLRPELDQHRKVFEVLGAKTKCEYQDEQLSGLGFSSTRGETVKVLVRGRTTSGAYEVQM